MRLQNSTKFSSVQKIILFSIFFLACTFINNPVALAQSSAAQNKGVSVTPSIAQIDLATDSPEVLLNYANDTSDYVELNFSAQDFAELEDGWKVKFLEKEAALSYQYTLTPWIDFEKRSISLAPGESSLLKITIKKDELSPGGHYATILAEITQQDQAGQVKINSMLSSIVFVRAHTGKEIEIGSIRSFEKISDWFKFPMIYKMSFQNSGNTILTPYGVVEVKNRYLSYLDGKFGDQIQYILDQLKYKGILNENSTITLPNSIRKYELKLMDPQFVVAPGVYDAKLTLKYGKNGETVTSKLSFIYLGFLIPLFFILIVLFFIIKFILGLKNPKNREAISSLFD